MRGRSSLCRLSEYAADTEYVYDGGVETRGAVVEKARSAKVGRERCDELGCMPTRAAEMEGLRTRVVAPKMLGGRRTLAQCFLERSDDLNEVGIILLRDILCMCPEDQ